MDSLDSDQSFDLQSMSITTTSLVGSIRLILFDLMQEKTRQTCVPEQAVLSSEQFRVMQVYQKKVRVR